MKFASLYFFALVFMILKSLILNCYVFVTTMLLVGEVWGSNPKSVKSTRCCHRGDVSSELCCPSARPQRWAPPLATCFGVMPRAYDDWILAFFYHFFRHLVQCMQRTLFELMPAFLSDSDEDLPGGSDVVDLKKQNRNTSGPTMCE